MTGGGWSGAAVRLEGEPLTFERLQQLLVRRRGAGALAAACGFTPMRRSAHRPGVSPPWCHRLGHRPGGGASPERSASGGRAWLRLGGRDGRQAFGGELCAGGLQAGQWRRDAADPVVADTSLTTWWARRLTGPAAARRAALAYSPVLYVPCA